MFDFMALLWEYLPIIVLLLVHSILALCPIAITHMLTINTTITTITPSPPPFDLILILTFYYYSHDSFLPLQFLNYHNSPLTSALWNMSSS